MNYRMLSLISIAILFIVNLGTWLILTEYMAFNLVFSGVCVGAFLAFIFIQRKRYASLYQSHWFKSFSGAFIGAVLIAVILGFVNYVGFKHSKSIDLSGRNIFSLPVELKTILEQMNSELTVQVIVPRGSVNAFQTYLRQLKEVKRDINETFFEPHLRPDLLEKYNIDAEKSIILFYKNKKRVLTSFKHIDFAKALRAMISSKRLRVGYITNHNEASLSEDGATSISHFQKMGQAVELEIEEVNLLASESLSQYDVVMLWGPKFDLSTKELKILSNFLASQKSLMVSIDPEPKQSQMTGLRNWLHQYGVAIKNSYVIDRYSYVNGSKGSVPIAQKQWGAKDEVKLNFPIFFPLASHIEAVNTEKEGADILKIEPLIVSTNYPHSWAEMNPEEMIEQNYLFNEDQDVKGPVTLAALVELSNKSQLFVLGNSKLIENNYKKFKNNFDFIFKSIDLLGKSSSVGADLKILSLPIVKEQPLFIAGPKLKLVFYLTIIIFPGIFALFGFYVYRMRLD